MVDKKLQKFLNYVSFDTQSDDTTGVTPSTQKQTELAKLLVKELLDLGLTDAHMDEFCNVYAHMTGEGFPIGLNAHMDTALELSGANVKPTIVKNFDGSPIKLNEKYSLTLEQFPMLKNHIGNDLVVTDGNTLLGADDKAGIAIIMNVLEFFKTHPEIKHHPISICFTVDEEIGEGPLHFNLQKMNAEFAYTIDGSSINLIEFENFNAQVCHIIFKGVSVHPGEGKDVLINALLLCNEFIALMPAKETPFYSSNDDGFWHLTSICGSSEEAKLSMILRDFSKENLDKKTTFITDIINMMKEKYPKCGFHLSFEHQYDNMREFVEKNPLAVKYAETALKENGLNPVYGKIRGGTDGATFSKMGLITPNLGTGSYNHHGRYEFLDVNEFNKMIDVVISLMQIYE